MDGDIIGASSATNCNDNCKNGMAFFDATLLGVECYCRDGSIIGARSEEDCENKCKALNHCGYPEPHPCVEALQENVISESGGVCHCVDGMDVFPSDLAITAGSYCNEICSDMTLAKDLEYHGISWNLKVGHDVNAVLPEYKGKNFTVNVDKVAYYDFSGIKDCKGNLVHIAINFTGTPDFFAADVPDEWCCMDTNPACGGSWGSCCNAGIALGDPCFWCILWLPNDCYNDSHLYPSLDYPIYAHIFDTVSFTPAVPNPFPLPDTPAINDPEEVWVGISVKVAGACTEFERLFQVDVIP